MSNLLRRKPDSIHARLKAAIEVPTERYLWVPADAITFVPALLDTIYGDGRALFKIGNINQRPKYWVIRGDSRWQVEDFHAPDEAPDLRDFIEEDDGGGIIVDLEDQFGKAQCGYCGQGLSAYTADDPPQCSKPECDAQDELVAGCGWPSVDDHGDSHWGRIDWPEGFNVVGHPFARTTLLADPAALGETLYDECVQGFKDAAAPKPITLHTHPTPRLTSTKGKGTAMPLYNVTLYPELIVRYGRIEAATAEAAVKIAQDRYDDDPADAINNLLGEGVLPGNNTDWIEASVGVTLAPPLVDMIDAEGEIIEDDVTGQPDPTSTIANAAKAALNYLADDCEAH